MLVFMLLLAGCKGPAGDEGPPGKQGDQGKSGAVGPAGDNGSVIYAGKGAPADDIGKDGDYYLNNKTGELSGPKTSDSWGKPGIVLMGDDGKDGKDGQNGADGKDGSQILANTGAPDNALGAIGDYYLDRSSYELYGPKTNSGWGMVLNLKGTDGNANVTRYMFGEHDFSTSNWFRRIPVSYREMQQSTWIFYMVKQSTNSSSGTVSTTYYSLPGSGYITGNFYEPVYYNNDYSDRHSFFRILVRDGSGGDYDRIEIVRIKASNTIDKTKIKDANSIIPKDLDVSDYQSVADYYGFGNASVKLLEDK